MMYIYDVHIYVHIEWAFSLRSAYHTIIMIIMIIIVLSAMAKS